MRKASPFIATTCAAFDESIASTVRKQSESHREMASVASDMPRCEDVTGSSQVKAAGDAIFSA